MSLMLVFILVYMESYNLQSQHLMYFYVVAIQYHQPIELVPCPLVSVILAQGKGCDNQWP